jgi:hypothetical protein
LSQRSGKVPPQHPPALAAWFGVQQSPADCRSSF